MKIRWREHETILITIIAIIVIAGYIWQMLQLSPQQINADYAASFIKAHPHFNYYTWVLFPQIGSVLVLYLAYTWINRIIVPSLLGPRHKVLSIIGAAFQIIVITYIIGPCVNFASFYINPYYNGNLSYLPLSFGFHPQPFLNLFGGFDQALVFLMLYGVYLFLREIMIHYFENLETGKAYKVLVVNQVTLMLLVILSVPVFALVFNLITNHVYYIYYFAFTLPVPAVFVNNIYWLFPLKRDRSFFNWSFLFPLLLTTNSYTLIAGMVLRSEWSWTHVLYIWAVQLFFVTPVSWLIFQQRKDKIMQLKGLEKALVKSTADLQFLRSQINPHFLFNALNTLYGTALMEGSINTAEGIQKLGDMMRFMLHENTMDFIPMEREIAYLRDYISLQKLRIQTSPDMLIEDNITDQDCTHLIAPMLLIPFVENAFKHGVSLTEKSWIKIKLECKEHHISFEVRNSVHSTLNNDPEREQSGIGLKNVQERLQILYKGKHEFSYGVNGDEYVVQLKIEPVSGKSFKIQINLGGIKNA